ncbi:MAG: TRAP transporter permease [Desulfobacterales bacterium]|nr:TRAP transporter permease [Desulfobacterales bacterium]
MNEVVVGIVGLSIVLLLFLTGIELAFAMILMGFLGFGYLISFDAALNLLAKDVFDVLNSYGFTVIPLFVLMGQVAFNSGIAKRLFDAAYKFIGHVPGGLAMATVAGATAFKSICGSSPATAATFASVAVPEMDRYNYDKRLSTGIVAVVGTLGVLLATERNPHPLWNYYGPVHRATLPCRDCPRLDQAHSHLSVLSTCGAR